MVGPRPHRMGNLRAASTSDLRSVVLRGCRLTQPARSGRGQAGQPRPVQADHACSRAEMSGSPAVSSARRAAPGS